MSSFVYYLLTFLESIASVFGLRFAYEQPRYTVIETPGGNVEIRRYEPRHAVEVTVGGTDRESSTHEAFTLLFRYIAGANLGARKIAMTAPVRTGAPERIAMTAPVETAASAGAITMRFFLPRAVAEAGAPAPLDPRLRLVGLAETTIAALRYSGVATQAERDRRAAALVAVLAQSRWRPEGEAFELIYDPPFAIAFLRRNEIAVRVGR